MPYLSYAYVINNTNFANVLSDLQSNKINSSAIEFELEEPLTNDQLNQLQVALKNNKEVSKFCLRSCHASRLELLNIFRGLDGCKWLLLQLDYPLELTPNEFMLACDIIKDEKKSLELLYLSIPKGYESKAYEALRDNYSLNTISLFGYDEYDMSLFQDYIVYRNTGWLNKLEHWLNNDIMSPMPPPALSYAFLLDEDPIDEDPLEEDPIDEDPFYDKRGYYTPERIRQYEEILEHSSANQLYEGLRGLRPQTTAEEEKEGLIQELTAEGKQQLFQILTQAYPHPQLQRIASYALGHFLLENPKFLATDKEEMIRSLLIINAFKKSDFSPTTENFISEIRKIAVAIAILKLQHKDASPNDIRKFTGGEKQILDFFKLRDILNQAVETLKNDQNASSVNELNLLNAIGAQKSYHPLLIKYMLECPSLVKQMKTSFPSLQSFFIVEDCLSQNTSIREIDLNECCVAKLEQTGIPKDRCPSLAAELRSAKDVVLWDTKSLLEHLSNAEKTLGYSPMFFPKTSKAESSAPDSSLSNQP